MTATSSTAYRRVHLNKRNSFGPRQSELAIALIEHEWFSVRIADLPEQLVSLIQVPVNADSNGRCNQADEN